MLYRKNCLTYSSVLSRTQLRSCSTLTTGAINVIAETNTLAYFPQIIKNKKCYITLATSALNVEAETNALAYSPKIVKIARTKILFTIELNVVPKQTL
jgi:hypothetical protein